MKLSEVDVNKVAELTLEQKNKIVYGGYVESTLPIWRSFSVLISIIWLNVQKRQQSFILKEK